MANLYIGYTGVLPKARPVPVPSDDPLNIRISLAALCSVTVVSLQVLEFRKLLELSQYFHFIF
jgi:hypothetical protein